MCQTVAHCSVQRVPLTEDLLQSAPSLDYLGHHLHLQILAHSALSAGVSFMSIFVHHSFVENHISTADHLLVFVIPNVVAKLIFAIADEGAFLRFGIKLIPTLITNMKICYTTENF